MTHHEIIDEATRHGTAKLLQWTTDGTLITLDQLAQAWGLEKPELKVAVEHRDLFQVWVDQDTFFPSALVSLGVERAAQICQSLAGSTASSKLIFLLRPHGGLGDKTVVQALEEGMPLSLICAFATEWVLS